MTHSGRREPCSRGVLGSCIRCGLARPRSLVGGKPARVATHHGPGIEARSCAGNGKRSCSGRGIKKGEGKERRGNAMLTAHPEYGYSLSEIPRHVELHHAAMSKMKKEGV